MKMNISLNLLSTFITFVESDNIVHAAKKLHVSQPAVSLQLKKLESLLPHPLFSFEGKKKALSHYGNSLYNALKGYLPEIYIRLHQVNILYANPDNISLRVGARKEILKRIISHINFPGKVEFMDLSNVECISMLLSHQIDIAVTHERPNLTNIISKRIFSDHTRLYVHRKFLRKKNLTLSHAKSREFVLNTPCILYKKENPPFIMAWLKYCKMELSSLKIKSICDDWSSILVMIENGLGFSLIPSSFSSRSRDVLSIDIPKDISPENIFYLLYHTDVKHIRAIKNFINAPL